jgi:hypothetical protein
MHERDKFRCLAASSTSSRLGIAPLIRPCFGFLLLQLPPIFHNTAWKCPCTPRSVKELREVCAVTPLAHICLHDFDHLSALFSGYRIRLILFGPDYWSFYNQLPREA